MKIYRASETPLAMLCAGSVNAPDDEILIDSVNPAGTVGTVVHRVCERVVKGSFDYREIEGACQAYGLDASQTKEVGSLIFAAKTFWDQNKDAFPNAKTEVPLTFDVMSGHVDVLSIGDKTASILDWKSTRLDVDYTPQMLFYAWLVVANFPKIARVKTVVVFLRDRTANIKEWTKEQILGFEARYTQQVLNWDSRTYRPGGHCAYCRRAVNCEARRAILQDAIVAITKEVEIPEGTVELYQRVQVLETTIKRFRDHLRSTIERIGYLENIPGDKRLVLVPSSRDTINARKAWPVLAEIMEPDDFADAVEIKKGPLMEAIAKQAPRGKKMQAKADLLTALKEADAITTTEFTTLRVVQNNETEVELVGTETE